MSAPERPVRGRKIPGSDCRAEKQPWARYGIYAPDGTYLGQVDKCSRRCFPDVYKAGGRYHYEERRTLAEIAAFMLANHPEASS